MDTIDSFRRLFAYDEWANREALASLASAGTPPARALRLMAHVAAAERLWLERSRGERQSMPVWPELSLDECAAHLAELPGLWRDYLASLTPARLAESVAYTNSKGEPWTSVRADVLTHVVMHSAYHRGQVALDVRAAGATPAYTDFIHAVRQGLVE